ncbi:hypothetical protein ILUMI_15816, partial [Ignelater luminosus]
MIGGDCCQISLRTLICFSFSASTPVTLVTTASDTVRNDDTHRVRSESPISFFVSTPVAPIASTSDADVAISSSTINNKDCSSGHDNQISSNKIDESELFATVLNESMTLTSDNLEVCGRRIVNVEHLFKQIFNSSVGHEPFNCNITNMYLTKERRVGLISIFHLKCKMCGLEQTLETDVLDRSTKDMDVNLATTLAAVSTGIGYSQCEEMMAVLNVPFVAHKTYQRCHKSVAEVICKTALQTIEEADKEEAALAIASGDVDEEGLPLLTVVMDGAWCKCSHNVNYDAASGVV